MFLLLPTVFQTVMMHPSTLQPPLLDPSASSGIPVKPQALQRCKELDGWAISGTQVALQRWGEAHREQEVRVLPDHTRSSFGMIAHPLTTWNVTTAQLVKLTQNGGQDGNPLMTKANHLTTL